MRRFLLVLFPAAAGLAAAACLRTSMRAGDSSPAPPSASSSTGEPFVAVLGTAQDGGLPHAACTCSRCQAARMNPARRRNVASLAVVLPSEGRSFLVDATPDIRDQLERVREAAGRPEGGIDRHPVDGVFLTHAHIGHYLGLAFFGFEAIHASELPVICTARMAAFLRSNGPWDQMVRLGEITLRETPPGSTVAIGAGVTVTPLAVPHRDEYTDTVGYFIEGARARLLYVPDTDSWQAWSRPLTEVLRGVDVAILDGSFYSMDELPGRDISQVRHPLVTQTMDLLEPLIRSGRTRVFLTHLNHTNPALDPGSPERRAIDSRGFQVLEEGQRFPL